MKWYVLRAGGGGGGLGAIMIACVPQCVCVSLCVWGFFIAAATTQFARDNLPVAITYSTNKYQL